MIATMDDRWHARGARIDHVQAERGRLASDLDALNAEFHANVDRLFSTDAANESHEWFTAIHDRNDAIVAQMREMTDRLTELSGERWWIDKDDEATLREQPPGFD
jgi:hypothetical protein